MADSLSYLQRMGQRNYKSIYVPMNGENLYEKEIRD